MGLYDPGDDIAVRVLHWGGPLNVDEELVRMRLDAALRRREPLVERGDTTGYRMVFGESDALPGLVLDRYGQTVVVKLYTAVWFRFLPTLLEWLRGWDERVCVVLRLSRLVKEAAGASGNLKDGAVLVGALPASGRVGFVEYGVSFECDPVAGQKTGFFLDQRENRVLVGRKSAGATVLNLFSYSGGFSVHAAVGGATEVTSVDIAPAAMRDCDRHMRLNAGLIARCRHHGVVADVFEYLESQRDRRWDVVVVDPPSFAHGAGQKERALVSYRNLAQMSARVVSDGGLLVLASCSRPIRRPEFMQACDEGLERSRRRLDLEELRGHALDHPADFAPLEYLKCAYYRARA